MTAPALTFIPDILEEHLDELAFLWGQRERALRSPLYTLRSLGNLEERVEAHLQGVLVVGDRARPLLLEALEEGDRLTTFAAAFALLRSDTADAPGLVLDALSRAGDDEARLDGLRTALSHAATAPMLPHLQALFRTGPPLLAAAAVEALTFRSDFHPTGDPLIRLLRDEQSPVRRRAWRAVASRAIAVDPELTMAAFADEDPTVRREALLAAAWSRQPELLPHLRRRADAITDPEPDDLDDLYLLAVLGGADDLQRMTTIARLKGLGPGRFHVVAASGSATLVELVLGALSDPDPAVASAAGAAFEKLTGTNVDSGRVVPAVPADRPPADDFEAEFVPDVMLPDPERARRLWQQVQPNLASAICLCRGHDVARGITPDQFATLDLESRWEVFLRSRFTGAWPGEPMALETFPQQPR